MMTALVIDQHDIVIYAEKTHQFSFKRQNIFTIITFIRLLLQVSCGHHKCCKQKCESGA